MVKSILVAIELDFVFNLNSQLATQCNSTIALILQVPVKFDLYFDDTAVIAYSYRHSPNQIYAYVFYKHCLVQVLKSVQLARIN